MKTADIIVRSYKNVNRNKSRSSKSIISIAIGVCCVVIMISLFTGAAKSIDIMNGEIDELLKIRVPSVIDGVKGEGLVTNESFRPLNDEDIKYLTTKFNENTELIFTKMKLGSSFTVGVMDNYSFRTNAMAIDYKALSEANINYYEGGNIKDLNGAIVSKSFISKALTNDKWESGNYSDFKEVDILGKELIFKVRYLSETNGKVEQKEIDVPVRIDGIIEDDNVYFGNDASYEDNDLQQVFKDSAIYIPLERIKQIKVIQTELQEVVLQAKNVKDMDYILEELKKNNFEIISSYEQYISFKYMNFTLKLLFGILGVLILLTAVVGIVNSMIMSVLERKKEIAIFKAIGMNPKNINNIYILESSIIGLIGGVIGTFSAGVIYLIINLVGSMYVELQVAYLSGWTIIFAILSSVIICALASIPCLKYISKISILEMIS